MLTHAARAAATLSCGLLLCGCCSVAAATLWPRAARAKGPGQGNVLAKRWERSVSFEPRAGRVLPRQADKVRVTFFNSI